MRLVEAGTIERAIGIHIEDYPPLKLESGKSVGGRGTLKGCWWEHTLVQGLLGHRFRSPQDVRAL